MSVGVVVITAGRDQHLARALQGLEQQLERADRVVVVDMAADGTAPAAVPPRPRGKRSLEDGG